MQAGTLTESIEILSNTGDVNAYNERGSGWTPIRRMRAQVTAQNGRRALTRGEVWYPTVRVFKIRIDYDITEPMRVRYQGVDYAITSIVHDRADRSTTISCDKVNP